MSLHLHRRGFTLVEVLVAMTVLAVLTGMAWRGIDMMLRTRAANQASRQITTRLGTAMTQWRQDLEALVDPATANATPASVQFDGKTLRLVRSDGSALRVVAWSRQGNQWMRWASPPVTRVGELQEQWFRSLQLLGNEPGQVLLLKNLDDFQVTFRDDRGSRFNAQSTGDRVEGANPGTATPRTQVPRVIELTLSINGLKVQRNLFTALRA